MTRYVVQLTDEDGEVTKGNDRMWKITLHNRGRVQVGTATVYRLTALFFAIRKRYPGAHKSARKHKPVVMRTRIAGPLIAHIEALDGPVASLAAKH